MKSLVGIIFLISVLGCSSRPSRPLLIGAASSLQCPLDKIVENYNQISDVQVEVIYGSSGKLCTQILQGAPYDLFISAGTQYSSIIEQQGKASGPARELLTGKIVILIKPGTHSISDETIKRISIPNPEVAPYGIAAMEVLNSIGLQKDQVIVRGESASQAMEFFMSGNADAAIVPYSLLCGTPHEFIEPDSSIYSPVGHQVVEISKDERIREFQEYLGSSTSGMIWQKYGLKFNVIND